jgi:hypothetical protein
MIANECNRWLVLGKTMTIIVNKKTRKENGVHAEEWKQTLYRSANRLDFAMFFGLR